MFGDEGREHREERHLDRRSKCEILSTMVRMFEGEAALGFVKNLGLDAQLDAVRSPLV